MGSNKPRGRLAKSLPPEVQDRAVKAQVSNVDWYAGRVQVDEVAPQQLPPSDRADLESRLRTQQRPPKARQSVGPVRRIVARLVARVARQRAG